MEVDKTLVALWCQFEYSPRKLSVFKHVQEVYGEKPLQLVKVSMTRWLSHLRACSHVVERYECLLDCLDSLYDESKEPTVYGVRHCLTKTNTVCMIVLLCDVLKPVNLLSLYLQEDHVNYTNLDLRVNTTVNDMRQLITKYERADFADTEFRKCTDILEILTDRASLARRMRRDIRVEGADDVEDAPAKFLQSIGIPFVNSLIGEIELAFESTPLLTSFGFLDPRNLPHSPLELTEYGNVSTVLVLSLYIKE